MIILNKEIIKKTFLNLEIKTLEQIKNDLENKNDYFQSYEEKEGGKELLKIIDEILTNYDNEISARNDIGN